LESSRKRVTSSGLNGSASGSSPIKRARRRSTCAGASVTNALRIKLPGGGVLLGEAMNWKIRLLRR
jgi:hypothetical protein